MNFSQLIQAAIGKAGKQETLATALGFAPSALSKRINGEVGWQEEEINKLLSYMDMDMVDKSECEKKINTLKATIKLLLEDNK